MSCGMILKAAKKPIKNQMKHFQRHTLRAAFAINHLTQFLKT